ncbi:MAG: hypothetical protein ACRED3_18150 [Bradyrhizobium sp.]
MSRPPTPGFVFATMTVAGASLAAATLAGSIRAPQTMPTRVASADTLILHSIEGGVQASGYIDGRPVPSGFRMPLVIRWQPRAQGLPLDKRSKAEASLVVMP